jgi:hypothetical protein
MADICCDLAAYADELRLRFFLHISAGHVSLTGAPASRPRAVFRRQGDGAQQAQLHQATNLPRAE